MRMRFLQHHSASLQMALVLSVLSNNSETRRNIYIRKQLFFTVIRYRRRRCSPGGTNRLSNGFFAVRTDSVIHTAICRYGEPVTYSGWQRRWLAYIHGKMRSLLRYGSS